MVFGYQNQCLLRYSSTDTQVLSFLGHLMGKGGPNDVVLTGKAEGKRSRGRPRRTYIAGKFVALGRITLLLASKDRVVLRTLILTVLIG